MCFIPGVVFTVLCIYIALHYPHLHLTLLPPLYKSFFKCQAALCLTRTKLSPKYIGSKVNTFIMWQWDPLLINLSLQQHPHEPLWQRRGSKLLLLLNTMTVRKHLWSKDQRGSCIARLLSVTNALKVWIFLTWSQLQNAQNSQFYKKNISPPHKNVDILP